MQKKDALGRYGEALAARFLTQHGWSLLARNWRCPAGELDIVAERDGVIAVCEVKTRRSLRFGSPLEAVTPEKAQRLRRLAAQWLATSGTARRGVRIDVISVLVDDLGGTTLQHIEGVC